MSEPSANDENQMAVIEPDQHGVAAVGAIAPNGQPQPDVFKLDTDCWDEVFDCLSLKDVHSFGQTCKAFQRVVGEYFQWKYAAVNVNCSGNEGSVDHGFIKFAKKIQVFREFSFEPNFESVKQITICKIDLISSIKHALKKCETVIFCRFNMKNVCSTYRFVYLIGVNMKRLEFVECVSKFPRSNYYERYLSLEHFVSIGSSIFESDQLANFLKETPNIRSIHIDVIDIWNSRYTIHKSNVKLDDLAIDCFQKSSVDIHLSLIHI